MSDQCKLSQVPLPLHAASTHAPEMKSTEKKGAKIEHTSLTITRPDDHEQLALALELQYHENMAKQAQDSALRLAGRLA